LLSLDRERVESRLINLDYQICDIEYNEFYLKDHLGNTRIRFADKDGDKKFTLAKNDNCLNEVFGSNHYYPFGMETEGPWLSPKGVENNYTYNGKEDVSGIGLLDYGARFYDPSIGRFISSDPMAELAPDWTPYRYGFNNPISYIDPDGMFETKDAAKQYAKDEGIKVGGLFGAFRKNKIVENKDGTFSIDNRVDHSSTQDLGGNLGILTGGLVAATDRMSSDNGGTNNNFEDDTFTLRDGSVVPSPVIAGTIDVGPSGGAKLTISAIKKALKEVHKHVGKLSKGKKGKFGSAQRGDKTKGYRLDREGHPNSKIPAEQGPHINWWDFSKGKWKKGKGKGRKGAEPID